MTGNGHESKVRYLSRVAFDNVSHPWIKGVVKLSFFMGPRTSTTVGAGKHLSIVVDFF